MKKIFSRIILLFCLIEGFVNIAFTQSKQTIVKPNIIIILTDDAGYADFGFQSDKLIVTPHIDALAKEGVIFKQAYVTAPNCSPSRAGLLTGRYQQRFGHEYNLVNPKPIADVSADSMGLPLSEKLLPQYLKEQGYQTAIIGKWHLGEKSYYHPLSRGFDYFFGTLGGGSSYLTGTANQIFRNKEKIDAGSLGYLTDEFGDEAVDYIDRSVNKTPFFLYLSFNAPHAPLQAKQEYLEQYKSKFKTKERTTYAGMIRSVDDNVGKLIAKLKEKRVLENTIIIFANDNGGPIQANASNNFPLRGKKVMFYEGGMRVPMFVYWKNKIQSNITGQVTSTLDILPSLLQIVDYKSKNTVKLDGESFLSILRPGNNKSHDRNLFWRQGKTGAVRSGNWKLIIFEDNTRAPELYNLATDTGETTNLYAKETTVADSLMILYRNWTKGLHAPLWTGGPSDAEVMKFYEKDILPKD